MFDWEKLLADVVNINSGTANTEGSEKVRKRFTPEFEELGFRANVHDVGSGHKVLSFDHGKSTSDPKLVLVGHLDTVFPEGTKFNSFFVDGDKLRGPGVIDMKGGVVLMLAALAELDSNLLGQIRIILNDDEETGSSFSSEMLKRLGAKTPYGLVFEPGLSDGTVVTSHSGVQWMELKIKGRPAHAGLEHHKGINACVELSHKITQIAELTDYPRKITVNPGVFSGGSTANTVCEHASAKIDVRYVDKNDLEELMKKFRSITETMTVHSAETKEPPKAELKVIAHMPSMPPASSDKLFAMAKDAAAAVGQKIKGSWVGYASDANHLAETGMQLLVGVGPFGDGMHTPDEYMSKRSFGERLQLNKSIIHHVLKGGP